MPGGQGAGHCGLRGAVRPGISGSPSARHPPLLGRTGRGAQPGRSAAGWQSPSGSLLARGGAAAGAAPPARPRGGARLEGRAAQPAALPAPPPSCPGRAPGLAPPLAPVVGAAQEAGTPRATSVCHEWRLPRAARKVASTAWKRESRGDLPERVSPRKTAGGWGRGGGGTRSAGSLRQVGAPQTGGQQGKNTGFRHQHRRDS